MRVNWSLFQLSQGCKGRMTPWISHLTTGAQRQTHRKKRHTQAFRQLRSFQSTSHACFCTVGGRQRTCREPRQKQGEHANSKPRPVHFISIKGDMLNDDEQSEAQRRRRRQRRLVLIAAFLRLSASPAVALHKTKTSPGKHLWLPCWRGVAAVLTAQTQTFVCVHVCPHVSSCTMSDRWSQCWVSLISFSLCLALLQVRRRGLFFTSILFILLLQ